MKSFRELRVWQAAMILVEKVYMLTQDFPKQEMYGLTSQIRRAAVSIPSNIAEGHTREHLKSTCITCRWLKHHWRNWKHNWRLRSACDIC
jgi:hypothetical protein